MSRTSQSEEFKREAARLITIDGMAGRFRVVEAVRLRCYGVTRKIERLKLET